MNQSLTKSYTANEAYVLLKTVLGSLLLAMSAQITLPFGVIPFTLQTSAVFFLAYKWGAKGATYAVLLYLLEGFWGLPVFSGVRGGTLVLFGPRGGYLWGFIPAIFVFDKLLGHSRKSFFKIFNAIVLSLVVQFALGYLQLASFIGFAEAYRWGVCPFLGTEVFKVFITSGICALSKQCKKL